MSLLALEHVSKAYRDGAREQVALSDVSLALEAGELAVVWGLRRSGRSTLLRVAAGIQAPDSGVVRFDGQDLALNRGRLLGEGIGYCRRGFGCAPGERVLDQVMVAMLARGLSPSDARRRAAEALARTGASDCAQLGVGELSAAEGVRAALARALVLAPRLLVIDEPTVGVELLAREAILALLRSLAREGIAILASTGDGAGLAGADRCLSLGDGQLHTSPEPRLGSVVALHAGDRRRASG